MAKVLSPNAFSMLCADVVVAGAVTTESDLHVDGAVVGDVTCLGLVQGESGRITGAIRADSARIAGTVTGPIEVARLVLLKTATVRGDITYDSLTVEQGAHVEGLLRRSDGAAASRLLG